MVPDCLAGLHINGDAWGAKFAVTERGLLGFKEQLPIPEQSPDQPTKV
jgi:hypothetical protein